MKLFKEQKGLTLIEIIVSMAILGIIIITFLAVFTDSIVTINTMGHRSDAVYQHAQAIIEEIHRHVDISSVMSSSELEIIIVETLNNNYSASEIVDTPFTFGSPPTTPLSNELVRFSVGNETTISYVKGFPFTILVFYQNGTQSVKLTSFIPKGGL